MIVVSDTSPITNLHAIGELQLLRTLYGVLHIPSAVDRELRVGVERGVHPPLEGERDWLIVHSVAVQLAAPRALDWGEIEAIALAQALKAGLLLMDDWAGREFARGLGLKVIGTLGVLVDAKRAGILLAVRPVLDRLIEQAGFWVSETLYQQVLTSVDEVD